METRIRAAALTNFFEVAQTRGLNVQPLLRKAGLKRSLLADPDFRVPMAACVTLLEDAAAASDCDNFALRMAESRQLADFGVISLLIAHQPNLRAALATLIRYRHLVNECVAMLLEDAGSSVIIRVEVVGEAPSRQAGELAMGVVFRLCGALLGARWQPLRVCFTHPAPADESVHRRLFRCGLSFNDEYNGIVCRAADLDVPNPAADPAMARHAQRVVEALPRPAAPSVAHEVRGAIALLLPMGRATGASVAQGLGMSLRTMQRALGDEGASFHDILHAVRREQAPRHVENARVPLAQVAVLLGYGSPSTFTRWFSGEFGMAPSAWRSRAAARGPEPADGPAYSDGTPGDETPGDEIPGD